MGIAQLERISPSCEPLKLRRSGQIFEEEAERATAQKSTDLE